MGLALQPPPAPGQFPMANGQLPPQFIPAGPQGMQQMPMNPGWQAPGQQFPAGFVYPNPYHNPMLPPPQLQPPPLYRGFYGPGNQWHAWDAQWLPQGQQPPGQANPPVHQDNQPALGPSQPSASSTTATGNVFGVSSSQSTPGATPTETPQDTASGSESAAPSQHTSGIDTSSNAEAERSATPRDSAALAALRRFESSRTPVSVTSPETRTSADVPSSRSPNPAEGSSISSTPGASSAAAPAPTPTTTAGPSNSSSQPQGPDGQPGAPPLIPLYDLSFVTAPLPPPHVVTIYPPQHGRGTGYRLPSQYAQGQRQPSQPATSSSRYRGAGSRQPLSQLPPTLTDEQLARLDRVTRDAIDERLRVLEGVSTTVYRCIEELTRLRSVLPPREEAALAALPNAPELSMPAASSSGSSSGGNTDGETQAAQPVLGETLKQVELASGSGTSGEARSNGLSSNADTHEQEHIVSDAQAESSAGIE
jgi:E3 ubiquitin-protein ligase synoviolin